MQHFNFLLQRVSSNIIAPILGQYQGPGYIHWSLLEGAKWSAISIALWSASWNGAWTRGINFGGSWSYCLLAWHTQWGQILYNVAFLICLSNKIVHKMSQVLKPNWRRWPARLLTSPLKVSKTQKQIAKPWILPKNELQLYYYDTWGRLIFIRFLEGIEDTKNISKLTDL